MSETRQAKYCPQCGTMAYLDTPICATCGYQFHTGVAAEPEDPDDDEFNKTQLFMMSPLAAHRSIEPVAPVPIGADAPAATRPAVSRRPLILGIAALLLVIGLVWASRTVLVTPPTHPSSVVGRWARASARGTVGLMFAADGSGALFWQPAETPQALPSEAGSVPLRWHQTPEGKLRLYPAEPAKGGIDAQQAVGLLASQAWPWSADARRLTLGKLSFSRQGI